MKIGDARLKAPKTILLSAIFICRPYIMFQIHWMPSSGSITKLQIFDGFVCHIHSHAHTMRCEIYRSVNRECVLWTWMGEWTEGKREWKTGNVRRNREISTPLSIINLSYDSIHQNHFNYFFYFFLRFSPLHAHIAFLWHVFSPSPAHDGQTKW